MRLIFSALIVSMVFGCTPVVSPQSLKYQHDGYDKATEPFEAEFVAPNGGYLFPFQDMIVEVTFRRDTIVDAYFYDKAGKPVHLDDRMKVAVLEIYPPGAVVSEHRFSVQLSRGGSLNHYRGKVSVFNIKDIDRAMSLRFTMTLPDPSNNYTRKQCHEGHWAAASPHVQEMALSKAE